MPELPEVETVKETLKKEVLFRTIQDVQVYYDRIIEYPSVETFKHTLIGKQIIDMDRRGKWLIFDLDSHLLFSHLRMEGKYFFRKKGEEKMKHEHVSFLLDNGMELRYLDTRKFGRMILRTKKEALSERPLNELGLEPFDDKLTTDYLKEKYRKKVIPVKTVLLDQSIIVGIGNIYADEILFLSKINPYQKTNTLTKKQCLSIIQNTRTVLEKAISLGGSTIRSYMPSEGVHGRFQNELYVHGKEICPICEYEIKKDFIGGRGTYYCLKCQKEGARKGKI